MNGLKLLSFQVLSQEDFAILNRLCLVHSQVIGKGLVGRSILATENRLISPEDAVVSAWPRIEDLQGGSRPSA